MINWASYVEICNKKNIINPYKDERDFNRAYNIQDEDEDMPVFIARKSASHKQVLPTLENHLKKCKAPKRKNLWGVKKAA